MVTPEADRPTAQGPGGRVWPVIKGIATTLIVLDFLNFMNDLITTWSPFLAFLVSGSLFAWCLLRSARSTPTILMSLLLGCFAIWNLFEWLWWYSGKTAVAYLELEFIGVTLAPAFAFHYAHSLAGASRIRAWGVTIVYSGTTFFLATALAALGSQSAYDLFMADAYNAAYLVFFIPVVVWTVGVLELSRRRAAEPRERSIYTYPLLAGLIMVPLGFAELAIPIFHWTHMPRLASLGALAGSIVIAVGVFRYRTVYDAFALLVRDSANVLKATVQGVLYLDPDGRVIFSNSVARELLGKSPRTLAEAGLDVPPSGKTIVRRGDRILELRVAQSDDVFPRGRRSLILQDKTRDYDLLQAFASREALADLGQGAATLAHEIRNPLTAIQSTLDCIVHDTAKGEKPETRHLELIGQEMKRLNRLLEETLDFSSPLRMDCRPSSLNALVTHVVDLHPVPDGRTVTLRLAPHVPDLSVDPDLIVQVILNLLRNAVEASPAVTITTESSPGSVVLRVSSAGARIPEEILGHLFQPFYTTKVKGTGLGLAVTRKIVLAHNGEITGRNSTEGVDFEVRFRL
jgi:signal transduction histidine kinase